MRYSALSLFVAAGLLACDTSPALTGVGDSPALSTGVVIGTEVPISWDGTAKLAPRISGDRIVWIDRRDGGATGATDIYAYDLATGIESRITTDPTSENGPDVSGDLVVWVDRRYGNEDIFLHDLGTGVETQVTSHPTTQRYPAVSGDWIVWVDYRSGVSLGPDIYKYHIPSGALSAVTNDRVMQYLPSVSGDIAVWEDYDNLGAYDRDIYVGNLTEGTVEKLYPKAGSQDVAHISGRRVTYRGASLDGNGDVYLYDLDTGVETFVHDGPGWVVFPRMSGDRIVWESRTDNAVYLYDHATATTTMIAANARDADISGNRVVYAAYRDGAYGIYVFEIEGVVDPDVAYIASRVDEMVATGAITNAGVAEALHPLLQAAGNHVASGRYDPAVRSLEAFNRLVAAQSGRGMTADAATELTDLAGLLIEKYQTP